MFQFSEAQSSIRDSTRQWHGKFKQKLNYFLLAVAAVRSKNWFFFGSIWDVLCPLTAGCEAAIGLFYQLLL
jgi:hypothetical protein